MPLSLKAIRPKNLVFIEPHRTREELRKGMEQYLREVRDILNSGYQTVPPGRRYRRTRRMHKGWRISTSRHAVPTGTLTNIEPHAAFVVGPRGTQAKRQRRRGWLSITDVARDTARRYHDIMNRSISPH